MAISPVPPKPDPALEVPDWIDTRGRVNEAIFAAAFLKQYPMKCIHGRLFTVDGLVDDEDAIRREIYNMKLTPWKSAFRTPNSAPIMRI